MRLLVVGGGQDAQLAALVASERGIPCHVLTRNPGALLLDLADLHPENISFQALESGYLSSPKVLKPAISRFAPTAIFYTASHHGPSGTMGTSKVERSQYHETSVTGLEIVLDLLSSNTSAGLLFSLSSRMFRPAEHLKPIDEETPVNPADIYGEFKARAWSLIRSARASGIQAGGLIYFNHDSFLKGPGYLSSDIAMQLADHLTTRMPIQSISLRSPASTLDISNAWDLVSLSVILAERGQFDDYVLASGKAMSAAALADGAAKLLKPFGLDYRRNLTDPVGDQRPAVIGNIGKVTSSIGAEPNSDALQAIALAALRLTGNSEAVRRFVKDHPNSISPLALRTRCLLQ